MEHENTNTNPNPNPTNSLEDDEIKKLFEESDTVEDEKEILDFDIDKEISELKIEMDEPSNETLDNNEKQLEEIADDIIKIQDRQAQKQMQVDLLVEIIKTIGFDVSNISTTIPI